MHWSPMLTDHDVANGLHSNTPIQVAGGGASPWLFSASPSMKIKFSCFTKVKGLVSPSATIFEVSMYSSSSTASAISAQTLWYWISMCFARGCARGWLTGLLASLIAAWLSAKRRTVSTSNPSYPIPFKLPAKNTDSFAALHSPTYSALAVEVAIVICLLLDQLIGPFQSKKTVRK